MNNNSTLYFGNFGVKHIPKEIKKFIGNKNIITNILASFCKKLRSSKVVNFRCNLYYQYYKKSEYLRIINFT